jgi:hypothetical protein
MVSCIFVSTNALLKSIHCLVVQMNESTALVALPIKQPHLVVAEEGKTL